MSYKVVQVNSRKELSEFISFPDCLYRNCPQYVPALHSDQVASLTRVSTLSYCERQMWMVKDDCGKVLGRICGMINPRYNELYSTRRARFGWFDTVDDIEVARLLIDTASQWARQKGMNEIHGPLYYNTLGKQGMLVDGFDNLPPFNCIYNYSYYPGLIETLGFEKECDWVQYKVDLKVPVPQKALRVSNLVMERYKLMEGSLDSLKKDKARVKGFFDMYNASFSGNVYNFVPFTPEEIEEESRATLKYVSDKASTILLDENGQPAAFGIVFPSISRALQKARGSLFPFGWFHLLKAMGDYSTVDLMVNGAAPQWQHKGVSSVYHCILQEKAKKAGVKWAITNPQIETNTAANIWASYDGELYMRRRCYIKKLY